MDAKVLGPRPRLDLDVVETVADERPGHAEPDHRRGEILRWATIGQSGRPAIQADLTVRADASEAHLQALIELARKRKDEPVTLDGQAVLITHSR